MRVGRSGYAYVVDRRGRLIADPDLSLVLRDTDCRNSRRWPRRWRACTGAALADQSHIAKGPTARRC